MGRQRTRPSQPLVHDVPQRSQSEVARASARQEDPDRSLRNLPSAAGSKDRARGRAYAGSRRKAVLLVLSQPARIDQQRQEPENRKFGVGTLYQLPHRNERPG